MSATRMFGAFVRRNTNNAGTTRRGTTRQPGILGPWLATGLGLFAFNLTPNVSATEPAYAVGPSFHAALAAPNYGSSLQTLAERSQLLAIPAPTRPVGSAAAGMTADMFRPIALDATDRLPGSADRLEERSAATPLPLPRTTDSTTLGFPTDSTMNERWAALRHCEATSNYNAVNRSGKYRGAYQFDQATWESVGGVGDPAAAHAIEQDKRARILFERRGAGPWPECGGLLN